MKKIIQKIKSYLGTKQDKEVLPKTESKQNIRVFCPAGLFPFFFKNVCIVAPDIRTAKRQYERMLRKEINLMMAPKESM